MYHKNVLPVVHRPVTDTSLLTVSPRSEKLKLYQYKHNKLDGLKFAVNIKAMYSKVNMNFFLTNS